MGNHRPVLRMLAALSLSLLGACGTQAPAPETAPATRLYLPPVKPFGPPQPVPPARSNHQMLQDFMDLNFRLESGQRLERLTRFDGPVTVQVTGPAPKTLAPDLARLLARLRNEAGIDIKQVRGDANITIRMVSFDAINHALPRAACFVAPNVTSMGDYLKRNAEASNRWSDLDRRDHMAIFVPADASPQEQRDCLHEELAQALGPLNDLYRLSDSVFNDDNFHSVLTGFDMLMLRAAYAPELHSGMAAPAVARKLPAILTRLNPAGDTRQDPPQAASSLRWTQAILAAQDPQISFNRNINNAAIALEIAKKNNWKDSRRAFSHFLYGRAMLLRQPRLGYQHIMNADALYAGLPSGELHRAFIATYRAAFLLQAGGAQDTLTMLVPHIASAERYENAALLASLLRFKAVALMMTGQAEQAEAAVLDSLAYARYAFGVEWTLQATPQDIAAIQPEDKP